MNNVIISANSNDLAAIFRLFEEAIIFQKSRNYTGWKSLDKEFIRSDVQQGLLYKIMRGANITGIFSICLSDALIWREKDKGDALYVHRVVLNRQYKGEKIFKTTMAWAVDYARDKGLRYIRIDTWAENEKIIAYYKSYGFSFIENYITPGTGNLPEQHRNLNVALLEFMVPDAVFGGDTGSEQEADPPA